MKVKIKASANASQRTKNRIKERGPWFEIEREHTWEAFHGNLLGREVRQGDTESWLLREVGGPDGDTWFGWLHTNEFEVIEKK